eukprot:scaffold3112_cov136-Isochrysis_galbana.AAC.2
MPRKGARAQHASRDPHGPVIDVGKARCGGGGDSSVAAAFTPAVSPHRTERQPWEREPCTVPSGRRRQRSRRVRPFWCPPPETAEWVHTGCHEPRLAPRVYQRKSSRQEWGATTAYRHAVVYNRSRQKIRHVSSESTDSILPVVVDVTKTSNEAEPKISQLGVTVLLRGTGFCTLVPRDRFAAAPTTCRICGAGSSNQTPDSLSTDPITLPTG